MPARSPRLRARCDLSPGRFQDAEVASEAVYASLNLLGLYHDSVLVRAAQRLPAHARPNPSPHTRYTQFCSDVSPSYRSLARALAVVGHVQLLVEMVARKRLGKERQWRIVLGIEVLKALLRLALLKITGNRPVIHPPVPEREIDPATLGPPALPQTQRSIEHQINGSADHTANGHSEVRDGYWTGKRTGFEMPTIETVRHGGLATKGGSLPIANGKPVEISEFLLSRVLTPEDVKRPDELVRKTDGVARLAEIAWILRPTLYVLAMQRFGTTAILPFYVSLAVDMLTQHVRTSRARRGAFQQPISQVEKEELDRRSRLRWWYLLRGPAWEKITRPRIERIAGRLEGKPLLSIIGVLLRSYVPLVDDYYFYVN